MKLLVLMLALASAAYAQQPQTGNQPLVDVNARITNGVGPGYWLTKQATGLVMNISSGTAFCSGTIREYAGGTLTMSPSTTNYVYLNTAASCAPAVKTAVFSSSDIPIAIVGTATSSVTTVDDVRTMFFAGGGGGGGCTPTAGGGPYPTRFGFGEVVYLTNDGTGCDSDHNLITDGNTLWMREGGNIEMDAPAPRDGDEYSLIDPDHYYLYSSTGNGGTPGIHLQIDDGDAGVGGGIGGITAIHIEAAAIHDPPTASTAVIDIHTGVGGAAKPANIFNDIMLESSEGGSKVQKFRGIEIQMNGNAAIEEESGVHVTTDTLGTKTNYCDFLSDDVNGAPVTVRAALGCDTDRHSNFGGTVTVPKLNVVGTGASFISAVPIALTTCPTPLAGTDYLCADYPTRSFQISNDGNPYFTIGGGGGGGVSSIDTQTGAFTFTGAGVSHVGTAYTFSGGGGGLTNNLLVNAATTGQFFCNTDSIGLPILNGFCKVAATTLGIAGANQHINNIGGASGADMASCVTADGCTAGVNFPYQVGAFPLAFPLGVANDSKTLLEIFGFNDLSNMGGAPTNTQLAYFSGGLKAWTLMYAIPDTQKITANNTTYCTTTGTWTAATTLGTITFPTGTLKTNTVGATITCTGLNATDAGFILLKTGTNAATFTMSVTNPGSPSSPFTVTDPYSGSTLNQTSPYTSAYGATGNYYAIGYPNGPGQASMSGGYTTVSLTTAGNSTDTFYVVGAYFISPSAAIQNSPAVNIMLETRSGANCVTGTVSCPLHNDTNTNTMRAAQIAVVNELRNNGLNVSYFDPNATQNGFNSSSALQSSRIGSVTITGGGSGFTGATSTVTYSGGTCTVQPSGAVVPISGGALTTGTYYNTSFGACTVSPTASFSGGGSGVTYTDAVNADFTHPNTTGAANIAAVAIPGLNSAATTADHLLPSVAPAGGGCTSNCAMIGTGSTAALTLTGPTGSAPFVLDGSNTAGTGIDILAHTGGIHRWYQLSAGTALGANAAGNYIFGDLTAGNWFLNLHSNGANGGFAELPSAGVWCWSSSGVDTSGCDTGISRGTALEIDFGSAVQGTKTATLKAAALVLTSTTDTSAIAGVGTATFAAGAAAGTSPGTPTCKTSHVCDSISGTISFTLGSATTTGILLTVTPTTTRTNQANCHADVYLAASPYTAIPVAMTETTTTFVFNVGTAPTASTAYELVYLCNGK